MSRRHSGSDAGVYKMMPNRKFPYTLLYVEDEEKIRSAYVRLLQRYFHEVLSARNGVEALKIYERYRPDIIVADIVMPVMNGLRFVEYVREEDQTTRVLFLTAHGDRERLLEAAELGISKYLVKPVKKRDLLESIERAVRQLEKIGGVLLRLACDCVYHLRTGRITCRGKELALTRNESILLSILASDPGTYLSIDEIALRFYTKHDKDLSAEAVKAVIKRLRKKVCGEMIENRFGHGYRLSLL